MTDPRAVALARNALTGGGRFVVTALLALAVTPFALQALGEARFGLWALAGALLTAMRLFDLGTHRALVRSVASAEGRGVRSGAATDFATGRGVMLLFGLVVVGTVWLLRDPLVIRVMRVPPPLWQDGRTVLVGAAVVAAIEAAFAPYQAGLDGIGRMDVSNGVDTVQRVASALGVVIVLSLGWGLPGLVWKNVFTALAAGLAYRVLLGRQAPELARSGVRFDRRAAGALLAFGRHVQAVNLGAVAVDLGGKLVLSRVVGLPAVATYELATRVTGQVGGALLAVAAAVFPAAAEAHASARQASDAALARLHRRAARYLSLVALPTYAILLALSGPFVFAWLGAGQDVVAASIRVLGAGWLVAVLSMPAYLVAQGAGRERLSTIASLVTAVVALAVAVVLVRPLGIGGVVAGVALGLALGGVAMWLLFARDFGSGWATIAFLGARPVAAAAAAAGVAFLAARSLPSSLLGVALAAGLALAAYGVLLVATGEWRAADRALAVALVRPREGRAAARRRTHDDGD